MNPFKKTMDSIAMSLPEPRMVRGYAVLRMPVGTYLRAIKSINDLPAKLIEAVFPGMSMEEILLSLKDCDPERLGKMAFRALTAVPEEAVALLSILTGISHTQLLEDEGLGLDGLLELAEAWLEVNDIENFTRAARKLWARGKKMAAAKTGSRG